MPYKNLEDSVANKKRYRAEHRDAINAKARQRRKDDLEGTRARDKKYQEKYKEKRNKRAKITYWTNRANLLAINKVYRSTNKDKLKDVQYRKRYGISKDTYDKLLLKQKNSCGICKILRTHVRRDFDVDHNHITGVVRGLLCSSCNLGIGYFKDDPSKLIAASQYLTLTREP